MTNYEVAMNIFKIASKVLEIEAPDIDFYVNDSLDTKGINSMFLKEEYKIVFSQDWLEKAEWLEVIAVCFHESRYAFQYIFINGN